MINHTSGDNYPISTRKLWWLIITIFVISRLFYWLIAGYYDLGFVGALCQWDCGWYVSTAQKGYMLQAEGGWFGNGNNWVFFPLYPMLVSALSKLTQLDIAAAGVLFSNLCIVAAAYLGVRYLEMTRKRVNAVFFIIFCFAGPYSFYFSSVYTEALFFLLVITSFYYWQKERYLSSGFVAALLSATRSVGVFWVVGMFVSLVFKYRSRLVTAILDKPVLLVTGVLAPLGFFLYMLYLHFHVGDAFAFMHGQVAWGRELKVPFMWLLEGFKANDLNAMLTLSPQFRSQTYMAIWGVIGLLLLLSPLIRRYWFEFTFAAIAILVPLSAGLESVPRFVIGMPVFVFAIHDVLAGNRYWPIFLTLLCVFNVWLLINWYQGAGFLT